MNIQERISKLRQIAESHNIPVTIRSVGGSIYTNVNGFTFQVQGFATFEANIKELSKRKASNQINLTSKLEKIEKSFLKSLT
jgi:hypothetical protein